MKCGDGGVPGAVASGYETIGRAFYLAKRFGCDGAGGFKNALVRCVDDCLLIEVFVFPVHIYLIDIHCIIKHCSKEIKSALLHMPGGRSSLEAGRCCLENQVATCLFSRK